MGIKIGNNSYYFDSIDDVLNYLLKEDEYGDLCVGDINNIKEQLSEIKTIVENHYEKLLKNDIAEAEIDNGNELSDEEIFEVINSDTYDANEVHYLFELFTKEEVAKIWRDKNKE